METLQFADFILEIERERERYTTKYKSPFMRPTLNLPLVAKTQWSANSHSTGPK